MSELTRAAATAGNIPQWLVDPRYGNLQGQAQGYLPNLFDLSKTWNASAQRQFGGLTQAAPEVEKLGAAFRRMGVINPQTMPSAASRLAGQLAGAAPGLGASGGALTRGLGGLGEGLTAARGSLGAARAAIAEKGLLGAAGGLRGLGSKALSKSFVPLLGLEVGDPVGSFVTSSTGNERLGNATEGAIKGAALGAPLAPFTAGLAPLVTGIGGGLLGGFTDFFGSTKQENPIKDAYDRMVNSGYVDPTRAAEAFARFEAAKKAGLSDEQAAVILQPIQEEFTANLTGQTPAKSDDELKAEARQQFEGMQQRAAAYMRPYLENYEASRQASNADFERALGGLSPENAASARAHHANIDLINQAAAYAAANPYAQLAQQYAPYLAQTYLGGLQAPSGQLSNLLNQMQAGSLYGASGGSQNRSLADLALSG